MRSEVDKENDELWKLIQHHSNKQIEDKRRKEDCLEGMVQVKGMENCKLE